MVEIEKPSPLRKLRKLYHQQTFGTGLEYRVHNHSYANLRRGLLERVFYVQDSETKELVGCQEPLPGQFEQMEYLKKKFIRIVGTHTRISTEQFVDCYQGRKRTVYEKASQSLSDIPLDRRDAHLKTFIKAEKFCTTLKPDPAPRVIQPRNPRYNVALGRYLKKFEHHAYRALDKIWGGPTVMKGYSVEEVGQHIAEAWGQFQRPVAIGFDMSRFDQHVSVPALRFEHQCYLGAFKHDRELQQLLNWQISNVGLGFASDGLIRYKKSGCRMSGDMNTALGNCLLACLITKHIFKGMSARLINNGDDCVLICDMQNLELVRSRLTSEWLKFGFDCIAEEPVTIMEEIRFCQMAPVYDGETWVMVRDPKVSMSKDAYSLVHWDSEKVCKQWLKAVGQCGERITGGIPIVQEYYMAYQRAAADVKENKNIKEQSAAGVYMMAEKSKRVYKPPTQEARYSFYLAFGILPDFQEAAEEVLRGAEIAVAQGPSGYEHSLQWIMS